jgi:heterodisulfide reductase subunit B
MASDYARSIQDVFQQLEWELVEIDDWSCCGASATHSLDETLAVLLPARNLAAAERMGLDIVAPCPNCFNRLRHSQTMIGRGSYLSDIPVNGTVKIHEMTRFLTRKAVLEKIQSTVSKPLEGLKVVCYYGCQMVRPPWITGFKDYENPQTLDILARAAGADVLDWSYKTTCCGASIGIGRRDILISLVGRLMEKARQAGADAMVVSCPLCQCNLDMTQKAVGCAPMPVFYFTELLHLAFSAGVDSRLRFRGHVVDPVPMLRGKGILP